MKDKESIRLARTIQKACIHAAREGFRDASMSGLCTDGASEAAISAIERINLEEILNTLQDNESDENPS